MLYSQKYSPRILATRVRESMKSLKSKCFAYTPSSNSSTELNSDTTPDSLDYQIQRGVQVLIFLKRVYQLRETLSKLDHGESVRSLKILTKRDSTGSYLVDASNADLKIIEMLLNIKRLELGMKNDMKYK